MIDACFAYDDVLREGGHFLGGEALQTARNATTLRYQNGKVTVTDGPFAETKEQLGGIFILEGMAHQVYRREAHRNGRAFRRDQEKERSVGINPGFPKAVLILSALFFGAAAGSGVHHHLVNMPNWFASPPASFEIVRQNVSAPRPVSGFGSRRPWRSRLSLLWC